jgi:YggT family protein
MLQLSRADFYNPISQFIVKATNPLLIPLRRIIPSVGSVDTASLVLAVFFQLAVVSLKMLVLSGSIANLAFLIALSIVMVLGVVLNVYFWALIIMIVSSWVAPGSNNPALVLINQIVEPLMQPFRKLLPPMGGLDLSPILVFLVIQVLEVVLKGLHSQVLALA